MEFKDLSDSKEFLQGFKRLVHYNKEDNKHYIASSVLGNKDMDRFCINYFGVEYTSLSSKQKKRIRNHVFQELM